MTTTATFAVWLHSLDITDDISLYVQPETADVAAVTAGLRKLAESAAQMADALESGASARTA